MDFTTGHFLGPKPAVSALHTYMDQDFHLFQRYYVIKMYYYCILTVVNTFTCSIFGKGKKALILLLVIVIGVPTGRIPPRIPTQSCVAKI